MKANVIDGSIVKGSGQPLLYSFVLVIPAGYKVLSQPETVHYKEINKSFLNSITFHLKNDKNKEVDFIVETLTFTLQLIKI